MITGAPDNNYYVNVVQYQPVSRGVAFYMLRVARNWLISLPIGSETPRVGIKQGEGGFHKTRGGGGDFSP